jgi:2-haloacid dehalogenase/putative hydrolase of the HAD superfamily
MTSEDCRTREPRGEIFTRALELLNLGAQDVPHAGDSFGSDVRGARNCGIRVLWINRRSRTIPCGSAAPGYVASDLAGLVEILSNT